MSPHRLPIAILLATILAGCAKNASQTRSGDNQPAAASEASTARPVQPTAPMAAARAAPNIPKDARWTIFCIAVSGPNHVADGNRWLDYLTQMTRMRDWYLVHSDQETTLYYGFYKEIDERVDPKEAARKAGDLRALADLINPNTGNRMFRTVFAVPLEGADPAAPPEWNLANAKGNAYYTLEICAYKDSPDRKQAAIDSVREARKEGVEAYYFHGAGSSAVCVGLFPKNAVRVRAESSRPHGDPKDLNSNFAHPGALVAVPGNTQVPDTLRGRDDVEVVQDRIEVVDPRLKQTIEKFPYHTINGFGAQVVADPRTGQKKEMYSYSVIVKVPNAKVIDAQGESAERTGPQLPQPSQPPTVTSLPPDQPADPFKKPAPRVPAAKGGKLKSIED